MYTFFIKKKLENFRDMINVVKIKTLKFFKKPYLFNYLHILLNFYFTTYD